MISPYALKPPSQFSGHIWPPGVRVESPIRVLTVGSMTIYRTAASDVANPRLANAPAELPKPLLERIMRDHPTFLSKPEI